MTTPNDIAPRKRVLAAVLDAFDNTLPAEQLLPRADQLARRIIRELQASRDPGRGGDRD